MHTNGDCTIFNRTLNTTTRRDEWHKTQLQGVYIEANTEQTHSTQGATHKDGILCLVPETVGSGNAVYRTPAAYRATPNGAYTFAIGDIIVKGLTTSTITGNITPSNLLASTPDAYTITSVQDCRDGSAAMWHFEIRGV